MSKFKYGNIFLQHQKVVKSAHNQMNEVQTFQNKIQFQEFKGLLLKTLTYAHKTDVKMTLNSSVSSQVLSYNHSEVFCCCKDIKHELKLNIQLIVTKVNGHVNNVSFTSKTNHPAFLRSNILFNIF